MPACFDPKFDIPPSAQLEIWEALAPSAPMGFALYGGTAIALQLGHRESVDFDFFNADDLDKIAIEKLFPFVGPSDVLQDRPNTRRFRQYAFWTSESFLLRRVKFGKFNDPIQTTDGVLTVASLDDLMATKLKTILDRAEAKDYRDLAAMISAGADLPKALSVFKAMFRGEPRTAIMALGYFEDGDVHSIITQEKRILTEARGQVRDLPEVTLTKGSLVVPLGPCEAAGGMRLR